MAVTEVPPCAQCGGRRVDEYTHYGSPDGSSDHDRHWVCVTCAFEFPPAQRYRRRSHRQPRWKRSPGVAHWPIPEAGGECDLSLLGAGIPNASE